MRVPSYLPGTAPLTFSATLKQRGILVWTCTHKHATEQDARACAIGEAEIRKCSIYVACPKCKEDVDYTIEHLNVTNGDWFCQPLQTKKKPTPRKRSV